MASAISHGTRSARTISRWYRRWCWSSLASTCCSPSSPISLPRRLEFGGLEHAGLAVGALIVGIAAFCAIAGPALVAHDAFAPDLMARLVPPAFMEEGSPEHLLGTDQIGRDYL